MNRTKEPIIHGGVENERCPDQIRVYIGSQQAVCIRDDRIACACCEVEFRHDRFYMGDRELETFVL